MNKSANRAKAWRWDVRATTFGLAAVAGAALIAIYFWQIFVTMPHLVRFYWDTRWFLEAGPLRGPSLYWFIKAALFLWNDFYAVAVAQGVLLGLNAALLAYAVWRVTRSALLMLTPLLVCLFKSSIIVHAQGLSTDSLFPILCIGLMACALLLYEQVSPWRIGGFLLFGFFACFLRSIGEVILWALLLVLALRLWPQRRRALGVLAAGCLGIHVLITGISHHLYGIWVPQAQAGQVLIIGAAFVAENSPPGSGSDYPHEFVAATAPMRAEYRRAAGWVEKYDVMDRYTGNPIQKIATDTLIRSHSYAFDRDQYNWLNDYGYGFGFFVMMNEIFQEAALKIIRENPNEYMKMVFVNLIAGVHMFTSYADSPMENDYGKDWADHIIEIARDYRSVTSHPELLPLIDKSIDDWQKASFELKSDVARPLRAFFGLGDILSNERTRSPLRSPATHGGALNWLFIIGSVLVFLLAASRLLRRQPIEDRLGVLLLFIIPTWAYLFVLCLMVRPYGTYMDATSSFVYIALLMGAWTVVTARIKKFSAVASKTWINEPTARGSIAQAE